MINSSSLSTPAPAASTRRSWAAAQSAHRPKHLLRIAQLPTLDWEVETSRMDLLNPCNNTSQYDKEHLFWDASVYFELHKFSHLPWFYIFGGVYLLSISLFLTCSILTAPESFRLLLFTETQVVVFNICITNACLLMSMMVRITIFVHLWFNIRNSYALQDRLCKAMHVRPLLELRYQQYTGIVRQKASWWPGG